MKIDRLSGNLVMVTFLVFICSYAFSPNLLSAKPITLRYANFFPPTHAQSQLAESWCHEVEKQTEGRVKVQYYAGQTLANAKQTYDSVSRGIADVGLSCLAYTRGRFPVMSAIDLPFGYPSGSIATAVSNYVYDKFKPKEFDETQVMFLHAHGPGFIHTRNKPVHKLEDLQGLKIRSTGLSAEVVMALGGTPVTMPMPECYQSLQKGIVDGTASPFEAMKGFKLAEVVDFTTAFFVVMNKKRWNALDEKDQQIITAINKDYAVKHGKAWDKIDQDGYRYLLLQGGTIIGLEPKESARWEKAVEPLFNKYVDDIKKINIDGRPIIDAIRNYLKENNN